MNANEALDLCLQGTGTEWGSSRIAEFRNCPYGHHLRYVEGVSPRRDLMSDESGKLDYFAVGNAVHAALAYVGLGAIHGFPADWKDVLARAAYKGVWPNPELEEARRLVWPYFASWGPANAGYGPGFKLVAVERAFETILTGAPGKRPRPPDGWGKGGDTYPYRYTGRADTITVRTGGMTARSRGRAGYASRLRRYVIWDHKTRSKNYGEDDELLSQLFKTRPQFLGLAYLAREELKQIPDLMVNIIVKTKIPAFRRILVHFTDDDLDQWAQNHVASVIHRSLDERWKNYSSCFPEIGQPCWATKWCHGGARERQTLFSITRKPTYERREIIESPKGGMSYPPKERANAEAKREKRQPQTERERETEERRKAARGRAI